MHKINKIALLLLLTLMASFAASADSFYPEAKDLTAPTETIQFVLDNSQEYYGFQAEIRLPEGLEILRGSDGEPDITLSARADGGEYNVNSNVLPDGSLIMSAFSANHRPFTGNTGVLVTLAVAVADDFTGGSVEVSDVTFVGSGDTDVEFDSTSATLGILPAYQTGDVNGDGKTTVGDVVALVNCIIGNKPAFFIDSVADVNGDGKLSVGDVVTLVNTIIDKQ